MTMPAAVGVTLLDICYASGQHNKAGVQVVRADFIAIIKIP